MRLAYLLANKFRQRRHQTGYLSFMSTTSVVGIALGCFVLITLLSVMNGFERELTQRMLAVIPHGELFSVGNEGIDNWQALAEHIEQDQRVRSVLPFTQVTGLIQKRNDLRAMSITGVDVKEINKAFFNAIPQQLVEAFQADEHAVILGEKIASELNLSSGDAITLLIPQSESIQQLKAPKRLKLRFVGSVSIGGEVDSLLGIMHLKTASDALNVVSGAKGLRISLRDPFIAPELVREYGYQLAQPVYMSDWTRTHGHIFQDIQLVRLVVYIVLTLVIAVACFNVVSTLVMAVKAKQSAIAILISMGATPRLIRQTFMLQGLFNGLVGTGIGVSIALLIAPNLTRIVNWIETTLQVKVLSSDVYFVSFLPTELHISDVLITVVIGLVLSVLAAWYPAARAARVNPAEVLS